MASTTHQPGPSPRASPSNGNGSIPINSTSQPIPEWFNEPTSQSLQPPSNSFDPSSSSSSNSSSFPLLVGLTHHSQFNQSSIPSSNLTNQSSSSSLLPPNPTTTMVTNSVPSPHLAKDADLSHIRTEVCSLMSEIDSLISETETVFTEIENIYVSGASPMMIHKRVTSLDERFQKLMSTLRISGLGALPVGPDETYDLSTLLESLQAEFHTLYRERQMRREGSAIVLGVLQAAPSDST